MIDDSDFVSRQMLLDQIDTMWVESIWLFRDRGKTERRCVQRRVEEHEEQTERDKTACLGTHGPAQTWLSQLQVTVFLLLRLKRQPIILT